MTGLGELTDRSLTTAAYSRDAKRLVKQYESRPFEDIHASILKIIPESHLLVLDIGAGSGRDAAWFADHGHTVLAVEPAQELRKEAQKLHNNPNINWIDDSLPGLDRVNASGLSFDLIWLSAVWMHIAPTNRERAFRKLSRLLNPGGQIMLSLRHGPPPEDRVVYEVTRDEVIRLARQNGLSVVAVAKSDDQMDRSDVQWENVVLQLPHDGTGAFPLLRNIIINDDKASTYKLALLRVLIRIADGASGFAEIDAEGNARVPLGLVALYWIRLFKPLLERGFRQTPINTRGAGLGFVNEPFIELEKLSPYDLRVGMRFQGETGKALRLAVRDAAMTIKNMPATYITYPGSDAPVFRTNYLRVPRSNAYTLDREFFQSYGDLTIPAYLWKALSRHAVWIEPPLVNEWVAWMQKYDADKTTAYDQYLSALQWLDPQRDTNVVRGMIDQLLKSGNDIRCVWTGGPLKENYDVDHCLPFSRWPCNDFWNLLPSSEQANRKKSDSLPSASALADAHERISQWWSTAYLANQVFSKRFGDEVTAALPLVSNPTDTDEVFNGVDMVRARLRRDQQLPEWEP